MVAAAELRPGPDVAPIVQGEAATATDSNVVDQHRDTSGNGVRSLAARGKVRAARALVEDEEGTRQMRRLISYLGVAAALAVLPQSAGAQPAVLEQVQWGGGGGGSVLCRVGPDAAARYRGGRRDCMTNRIGPGGLCYCPSSGGAIEGDIVRGSGGWGGGGGGWGPGGGGGGGGWGEPPRRGFSGICRISPEASRFTGGRRDCSASNIGPGGSCFCPSERGPIRGVFISR